MSNTQTLSVDFRLFQLQDRLQRLTKKVQTTLIDDFIKDSQVVIIPQLTAVINLKIEQFYKSFQAMKTTLSNQTLINNKIKELQPVLKNTILKQNKLIIESELKEIRGTLLKKKDNYTTTNQKESKSSVSSLELKEKIELVMQEIDETNKTQRRNHEFAETVEKLSYDRIDEMRQMMKLAIQELNNTKAEMTKNWMEFQIGLNKVSVNIPNKDSRLGGYQQLSEQIAKCLPRTQFEHIHLKKLNSSFEYLKDEVGAIKNIMNNGSEYQRYITRTVERIQRFNTYLTEHQNRRLEVEKLNFKLRIQKLESNHQAINNKSNLTNKRLDEFTSTIDNINNNLLEMSSTQNIEIKNIKDKLIRLETECHNNTLFKDNYFMPFRNQVNISFRRVNEEIETYNLIRGQIVLVKEELVEVERALTIMDAKISMLKQEFPRYQGSIECEKSRDRDRDGKPQGSMRYGKSVDQTTRSNIRVKNNSVNGTRYSVKFLRSLAQQNKT